MSDETIPRSPGARSRRGGALLAAGVLASLAAAGAGAFGIAQAMGAPAEPQVIRQAPLIAPAGTPTPDGPEQRPADPSPTPTPGTTPTIPPTTPPDPTSPRPDQGTGPVVPPPNVIDDDDDRDDPEIDDPDVDDPDGPDDSDDPETDPED